MTDNAKRILDNLMVEVSTDKAVSFIRERVFSDGITIPCRSWSVLNQFITFLSGTCDARGYNQWKEAGRQVKKGAKAIYILVPMLYKTNNEKSGEVQSEENREEEKQLTGFKAMPVFKVEDTEGAELDYKIRLQEFDPSTLPLMEVAQALGVSVTAGLTGNADAWFCPEDNSITMGCNNGQTFLHELSHAVDNILPGKIGEYAFKEVVAELSAAFLCRLYGYDCNVDNAAAYIRGWAGKAHGAFTLVKAMERVEAIYRYVEQVKCRAAA